VTLKRILDTGNLKRKHKIALYEELVLEKALDLSEDRLRNE
jgi:hypothetical protein